MPKRHLIRLMLVSLPLAVIAGCGGDSDPRTHHVKGTVTFQGKPVPAGSVQFVPGKGNSGPPGYAEIVDGNYDTTAQNGKATVGGPHTVIINGFDGKADPDNELPLGKQIINDYKVDYDVPKQEEPAVQNFQVSQHKV